MEVRFAGFPLEVEIDLGLMMLFPNSLDWGNGLGPGLLMMAGLYYVLPFTVFCSVLVILFKLFGSKTEEDRDL